MSRRNTVGIQDSEAEIRDYLIWFYDIPREWGWYQLKDYVRSVMGCDSVTYAEIIHDETTKHSIGHGWSTVKDRKEAIGAYYHYHDLRQWDVHRYLITLWEGKTYDPNSVVSETVPDIPGQGRAAGIRYRLFTLQDEPGESIAISSDPLFARLLKQYKEDVLSGTLTIESPTDRDRHWISSQQVYEYCANALHGTSNGVTRQPLSIRGLHQVDRASEDYQKTQSYFGRKAVEAKTYQNLYMAKCGYAPYTFSARQTTQSYAVPASIPKGLSGNLMEYFTARPSQISVFNHYGSLRTMTDGPDPIGILSDHTSKALSNTDHVTHRAEASTVFLRNLPYEATSEHLQAMFGSTGLRCAEVDVQKGCAVARFSSWGEASRAVQEHNGTNLMGRQIYVESDNRITVGPSANTSSQARILGVPETKSPIVVDGSGASGANSKLPRHRSVSAVNQMSNHPQKGPG